ncbi:MAG TPA: peptidoglycan-binding protein [Solirubrobacteraceae bacterium]|nr:peptidoglycan-binding protein [Solirubrobacteraceae bacterium]
MITIVQGRRLRAFLPVLLVALAVMLVFQVTPANAEHRGAQIAASVPMLAMGAGFDGRHVAAVARLQRVMLRLGYEPGPIDGLYGPLTAGAVRRVQSANGVAVDGIAGPVTQRALRAQGTPRARRVRYAQHRLRALGHRPGRVDGIFGPRTVRALRNFRDAAGLRGIVKLDDRMVARLARTGRKAKAPKADNAPAAPQTAPTTEAPTTPQAPEQTPATQEAPTTDAPTTTPQAPQETPATQQAPTTTPQAPEETPAQAPATEAPTITPEPSAMPQASATAPEGPPEPTPEALPPLPTPAPPVAPAGSVSTPGVPDRSEPAAPVADTGAPAASREPAIPTPVALVVAVTALLAFLLGRGTGTPPRIPTFHSPTKSALVRAVSVTAVVLGMTAVALGAGCGKGCGAVAPVLQGLYDVTAAATLAATACLLVVYVAWLRRPRFEGPARWPGRKPLFAIVIPARDDELTIGDTVRRVLELPYRPLTAIVINDGSSDGTTEMARSAASGDPRLVVANAPDDPNGLHLAALDHACRVLSAAESAGLDGLGGTEARDVVVSVLEPGAALAPDALSRVAPYFADPTVGAVQLPLRVANARTGLLARILDVESVADAVLVQGGRDLGGGVRLRSNGQFIRLAALRSLGDAPWTKAASERRGLGATLRARGWKLRLCDSSYVAQEGVATPRALLARIRREERSRRWSQAVHRGPNERRTLHDRLAPGLYWLLPVLVLAVGVNAVLAAGDILGLLPVRHGLAVLTGASDAAYRLAVIVSALAPLAILAFIYAWAPAKEGEPAPARPGLSALPGVVVAFALYLWVRAAFALAHVVTRRHDPPPISPGPTPAGGAPAAMPEEVVHR